MATTTNFGWETPDDSDLVKDGAAAMRTLGNSIDASFVDLKGGTSGQVLSKNSNTDLDFTWVAQDDSNAIQNAIVDAKGDLIAASAADTPARLAVGTNEHRLVAASAETTGLKYVADTTNYAIAAKGDLLVGTAADTLQALSVGTNNYVLTAASGETTGLKWAAPAGGGKVLQVVSTTVSGSRSTTSSSYVDVSGASASITPSSASSKILVIANCPGAYASNPSGGGTCYGFINTVRTSTQINEGASGWYISGGSGGQAIGDLYTGITMITLDEPATTSSTTYKLQHKIPNAGNTFYTSGSSNQKITLILAEIGA